jgi:hypothetical protein
MNAEHKRDIYATQLDMNDLSYCVVAADSCCVVLLGKFSLGKFLMNDEKELPIC